MVYIIDEDGGNARGKEWHEVGALRKQRGGDCNKVALSKALSALNKEACSSNK